MHTTSRRDRSLGDSIIACGLPPILTTSSDRLVMAVGRLQDTVAIITGGGGGIGGAAGKLFCREGCKVALVDNDDDTLLATVERIRQEVPQSQVTGITADLGEESAAQNVVDQTLAAYGGIDILINNVGIRRYDSMADTSWEMWDVVIRINFLSYTSMTRAALPSLRKSGRGSIVNTSSINAFHSRGFVRAPLRNNRCSPHKLITSRPAHTMR